MDPKINNPQTRELYKDVRNYLDKREDSLRDKAYEYLEAEQNNDFDKMAEIQQEMEEMMRQVMFSKDLWVEISSEVNQLLKLSIMEGEKIIIL